MAPSAKARQNSTVIGSWLKCWECKETTQENQDGEPNEMLTCLNCNQSCHVKTCLKLKNADLDLIRAIGWYCVDHKRCQVCSKTRSTKKTPLLFCEICETSWHTKCIGIEGEPEGDFMCGKCQGAKHPEWSKKCTVDGRPKTTMEDRTKAFYHVFRAKPKAGNDKERWLLQLGESYEKSDLIAKDHIHKNIEEKFFEDIILRTRTNARNEQLWNEFIEANNDKVKCDENNHQWYVDLRAIATQMTPEVQSRMRSKIGNAIWSRLISLTFRDGWQDMINGCQVNGVEIVNWDFEPSPVSQSCTRCERNGLKCNYVQALTDEPQCRECALSHDSATPCNVPAVYQSTSKPSARRTRATEFVPVDGAAESASAQPPKKKRKVRKDKAVPVESAPQDVNTQLPTPVSQVPSSSALADAASAAPTPPRQIPATPASISQRGAPLSGNANGSSLPEAPRRPMSPAKSEPQSALSVHPANAFPRQLETTNLAAQISSSSKGANLSTPSPSQGSSSSPLRSANVPSASQSRPIHGLPTPISQRHQSMAPSNSQHQTPSSHGKSVAPAVRYTPYPNPPMNPFGARNMYPAGRPATSSTRAYPGLTTIQAMLADERISPLIAGQRPAAPPVVKATGQTSAKSPQRISAGMQYDRLQMAQPHLPQQQMSPQARQYWQQNYTQWLNTNPVLLHGQPLASVQEGASVSAPAPAFNTHLQQPSPPSSQHSAPSPPVDIGPSNAATSTVTEKEQSLEREVISKEEEIIRQAAELQVLRRRVQEYESSHTDKRILDTKIREMEKKSKELGEERTRLAAEARDSEDKRETCEKDAERLAAERREFEKEKEAWQREKEAWEKEKRAAEERKNVVSALLNQLTAAQSQLM